MKWETLKNVFLSVAIGLTVSFVSHLAEAAIIWLQALNPEATGGAVGGLTYLVKSFKRHA